jgi:hypothetical protein
MADLKVNKLGDIESVSNIRAALQKMLTAKREARGTQDVDWFNGDLMFLEFLHRHVRLTWLKNRQPVDLILDAAWCIFFVMAWEEHVYLSQQVDCFNNKLDGKACLTQQTLDDVIIHCEEIILGIWTQKAIAPEEQFVCDRRSSRWAEYLFGDMRLSLRGRLKFNSKDALRLVRRTMVKTHVEQGTDCVMPVPKRGAASEAEEKNFNQPSQNYWDGLDDVCSVVTKGMDECNAQLKSWGFDFSEFDNASDPSTYSTYEARISRWTRTKLTACTKLSKREGNWLNVDDEVPPPPGTLQDELDDLAPEEWSNERDAELDEAHEVSPTWEVTKDSGGKKQMEECQRVAFGMAEDMQMLLDLTEAPPGMNSKGFIKGNLLHEVKELLTRYNSRVTWQSADRTGARGRFTQGGDSHTVLRLGQRKGADTESVSDDEDYAAMFTLSDEPNEVQVAIGTIEGIRLGPPKRRRYVPRVHLKLKAAEEQHVCLKTRWLRKEGPRKGRQYEGRVRMPHQPKNPICTWCPFGEYLTRVIMDEVEIARGEGQLFKIRQECMDDIIDEVYKFLERPGHEQMTWKDAWCTKNHWQKVVKPRIASQETEQP